MNRFIPLVLTACLLLGAGCATSPTSTTPPPTTAWKSGGIHDYERDQPGLGWSQRFTASQGWADVYFYDLRTTWTDMAAVVADAGPFEAALREIKQVEQSGRYTDVKILTRDYRTVGGVNFRHAVVTLRSDDNLLESHLFIAPYKGKLLKLRVSLFQPASEQSRQSLDAIVVEYLDNLAKARTA